LADAERSAAEAKTEAKTPSLSKKSSRSSNGFKVRSTDVMGRKLKSNKQVQTLYKLFGKHQGKISKKLREEAMAITGLAWS